MINLVLQSIGVQTETAESAPEGIRKASEKKYDIIFLDHMMPELDGIESFGIIRERCLPNMNTPVVMLTGNADDNYDVQYRSLGLDGYLVKPVMKEALLEILQNLCMK